MKIKKLTLNNFRQFAGEQTINFAIGNDKNVSIILGQNGAGKTGIFRAVLFSLFGDEHLSQDDNNSEIHLVNEDLMKAKPGVPVNCTVKLVFEHLDYQYVIERSVNAFYKNNQFKQSAPFSNLVKIDQNGQAEQIDSDNIDNVIASIIRKDIREFFFFDAESMSLIDDMTTSSSRKNSIKDGIFQLLQLKDLNQSVGIADNLRKRLNRQAAEASKDSDIQDKQDRLDKIDTTLDNLRQQNEDTKNNIDDAAKELEEKQTRYQDSKELLDLQDKIQNKKDKSSGLNEILDTKVDSFLGSLPSFTSQLMLNKVGQIEPKVKNIRENSSDSIPKAILEQSIENDQCALCGNNLEDDSHAYDHVQQLLKQFRFSQTSSYVGSIEQSIGDIKNSQEVVPKHINNFIKDYEQRSQELSRVDLEIENNEERLRESANDLKNIQGLGNSISNIQHDINNYKASISINEDRINEYTNQKNVLQNNLNNLKANNKNSRDKDRESKVSAEIQDALSKIVDSYSDSSRGQIEQDTLDLFNRFIGEKDRNLIRRIEITSNYQLAVIGQEGQKLTNDLSKGQNQILSLSFVTALARFASKGRDELIFPLFMDTPFGRISGENRDHLIHEIPKITGQWVLLVTDTELTAAEQRKFMDDDTVGQVYHLNNGDNATEISKIDDISELELRGDN